MVRVFSVLCMHDNLVDLAVKKGEPIEENLIW